VSEHAITLVEVGISADAALLRAGDVTDWLLAQGVIVPNPTLGLHQPSPYLAGPKVFDISPDARQFLPESEGGRGIGLSNSGVEIIAERQLHHPIENYEPPPCPHCGTPLDQAEHYGLVEEWLEGPEPTVTCSTCGQPSLIGDWQDVFTFYVGNLAVRFNNWSPLTDAFVADLGSRLGARSRLVFEHS
jgi:endogenous inhibitor of DNA gyrase (YacG/DUF329 family)